MISGEIWLPDKRLTEQALLEEGVAIQPAANDDINS
jgi:hypothetical protein